MIARRTSFAALLLLASATAALAQGESFVNLILSAQPAPLPLAPTDRIPVVLNNAPYPGSTNYLLASDLASQCAIFTATLSGCVPASGGGTAHYLRADGTWDTPSGTGISATAATPDIVINPSPGIDTFTIGTAVPLNPQSGVSYTIQSSDNRKTVLRTDTVTQTDSIPQATGSFGTFSVSIRAGTHGDTITSTTSTINGVAGATGIKLGAQQASDWVSDGANWWAALGVPQPPTQAGTTVLYDNMTWGLPSLLAIANDTVLGNVSGIVAVPTALSQTQLTTLINPFTSVLSGAVPASGGSATTYLNGAGGFTTPTSSVISVSNSDGSLTISPTTGAVVASANFANPSATAGASAVNGTAKTAMTSDSAPALPIGTSGATIGLLNANKSDSGVNSYSGAQTFGPVFGSIGNGGTPISAATYTFVAGDCGTTVVFTRATAVTATIPAAIVPATTVCAFAVLQAGAGKVSVNGSAVSPATLISESSFTGTDGTAGNMIGLTLLTISAAADAFLTGPGS